MSKPFFLQEENKSTEIDFSQCKVVEFYKDAAPIVAKVFNEVAKATYDGMKKTGTESAKQSKWTEKDILNQTKKKGRTIYLFMYDDEIVGSCNLIKTEFDEMKGVWLSSFGILKEYRRHGFGEFFLKEMMKLSKEKLGYNEMLLGVSIGNKQAMNLYKKLGFKPFLSELFVKL